MPTRSTKKPPWDRPNPNDKDGGSHAHLTPAQKAAAKRSAKAAGRPYPNLVDNMKVSRAAKATATAKKAPAKKVSRKTSARKAAKGP